MVGGAEILVEIEVHLARLQIPVGGARFAGGEGGAVKQEVVFSGQVDALGATAGGGWALCRRFRGQAVSVGNVQHHWRAAVGTIDARHSDRDAGVVVKLVLHRALDLIARCFCVANLFGQADLEIFGIDLGGALFQVHLADGLGFVVERAVIQAVGQQQKIGFA